MRTRTWDVLFWIFAFGVLEATCGVEEGEEGAVGHVPLPARYDDGEPLDLISAEAQDLGFDRERRKYSRRLWYINCTRRRRCHCYSRRLRQYFCCDCDSGPCFPGESEVVLRPSGVRTQMHRLRLGQYVLAANERGELVDSKILGFLDKRPNETAAYITLELESGQAASLSATHLIYAWDNSKAEESNGTFIKLPVQPMYAENVQLGYALYALVGGQLRRNVVTKVSYGLKTGAYVPLTEHGTIIVDGVLASCYASFPHWLAHAALMPARFFPEILLDSEDTQDEHGLRTLPAILKIAGKAFYNIFNMKTYNSNDIIKFFPHDENFICPNL